MHMLSPRPRAKVTARGLQHERPELVEADNGQSYNLADQHVIGHYTLHFVSVLHHMLTIICRLVVVP
jgi:hypothetical protein